MSLVNLGLHSWNGFIEHAAQRLTKPPLPGGGSSSQKSSEDAEWSGSATFADALKLAQCGWQDGASAIGKTLDRATPAQDILPDWNLDVCGAFPCVPAMLSGEPECVWRMSDERRAVRRLALVVQGSFNCSLQAEQVMVYAKAVAATARAIEASGIDVAVYSVAVTRGSKLGTYAVAVREYGEPMDLAKIAFAFHPAWLRRIGFAWVESTRKAIDIGIADCGYGRAESVTPEVATEVLGDVGAAMAIVSDLSTCQQAGELTDSELPTLIERFRVEVSAAVKAAGG